MSQSNSKEMVARRNAGAIWLLALNASLVLGAGYAVASFWMQSIAGAVVVIICAGLLLPTLYGATSRFVLIRLVIALIGAAIGLTALWGIRYGLEFSWADLWGPTRQAPSDLIRTFIDHSDRFDFPVTTEGGSASQGPSRETMFWMATTVMLGALPVFGAVSGPAAMDAIRKWRRGTHR